MKKTFTNAAKRYAAARALLLSMREDDRPLKFYNSYACSKTLKLFWFLGFDEPTSARRKRVKRVRRELKALADYTGKGERGGEFYGFTFKKGSAR